MRTQIQWEMTSGCTLTIQQDSQKVDGLGGEIWSGGYTLARFVEKQTMKSSENTVIELGAGCGLVGFVLSSLGFPVVLTDALPELLHENYALNHKAFASPLEVQVASLDWEMPLSWPKEWKHNFTLIVGSEITQLGKELHTPLLNTIDYLLSSDTKDGQVLLSMDICTPLCVGTCTEKCTSSSFMQKAREKGFSTEIVEKIPLAEQRDVRSQKGVNGAPVVVDEDDYSIILRLCRLNI